MALESPAHGHPHYFHSCALSNVETALKADTGLQAVVEGARVGERGTLQAWGWGWLVQGVRRGHECVCVYEK